MARTPVLGGGSLSPFGSGGADFGAFNIVDPGREAYLQFLKVKVDWEQGAIPNATYLTAYEAYVNAQTAGSSNRIEGEQSLRDTRYRLERNDLLAAVEAGTKTWDELITFDRGKLEGLNHASQEYLDRLNLYQQTQAKVLSDAAATKHALYDAGKLTTAQLRQWYRDQGNSSKYAGNPDLLKNIADQVKSLDLRVTSETDNRMIQMFNDGKLGSGAFLVYAATAKARYATGTEQERQWSDVIDDAKQQVAEKGLTYRYGLSQRYIDLRKFIADQSEMLARSGGKGSTSTSQRIVLGADGQWKTVTSTKSHAYKPSAAEQAAMADRRIELADAKRQLAEIQHQISASGGFVSTDSMIGFYSKRQGQYVKGSPEWYQVQERLDGLEQQKHAEAVLKKEGVRVTYGKHSTGGGGGGSGSGGGGGGGGAGSSSPASSKKISIDQFMRALARVESGGSYSATNKSSGAYGKYQIMPANWPSWAQRYLGDSSEQPTPENQEKVARGRILDLYNSHGQSWERVAHWWLTGNGSADTSAWSSSSTRYVNKVMAGVGVGPVSVSGGGTKMGTAGGYAGSGAGASTAASGANRKGPLEVVTGTRIVPKQGERVQTKSAGFPKNLDGSAFLKFYSGFNAAFDQGETTFTDWSSGRPIVYSIPEDLVKRAEMMQELDDLRIGYYQTRAQVYAGTPSEFVAANEYSNAIKDKADNAYTILITSQKGNATPQPGSKGLVDPIAVGLAVQEKAETYVKDQLRLAKLAMARGDVTGAYSHIQLAQKTMAETDSKLQFYAAQADATMQAIQRGSGAAAPDQVQGDFDKLVNWQDSPGLTTTLEAMDKIQGEIIGDPDSNSPGWAETDAHGNPVWRNGTIRLRDGAAVFLDESGKISFKDIPSAGYAKPGSKEQVPSIPGYVPITMNTGGTVVGDQSGGVTVYAAWHTGVVGFTGSGAPIYGKVVSGQLNGKRYTYVEDPFHPGKWSAGNITFAVPQGFSAVPGAEAGTTVYQFTGSDGAQYRLDWDEEHGQYNVIKAGNVFSPDQVLPAGDADTLLLLDQSGFKVDLSSVAPQDQWAYNMNGAHPGFDKGSWEQYTKPSTVPSRQRGVPVGNAGAQFTGIPWGGADANGTARRTPAIVKPNVSGSPDDRQAISNADRLASVDAFAQHRAAERDERWQVATLNTQAQLNASGSPDDRGLRSIQQPALRSVAATTSKMPTLRTAPLATLKAAELAARGATTAAPKPAVKKKAPTPVRHTSTTKKATTTRPKAIAPLPKISPTKLTALTRLA